MEMKTMSRVAAVVLGFVVMLIAFFSIGFLTEPVMAISKGKLVKECHTTEWYNNNGKWELMDPKQKDSAYIFEYNKKKDPVKIKIKSVYKNEKPGITTIHSYTYKYKNGKKIRRKDSIEDAGYTIIKYKKNVPVKEYYDSDVRGDDYKYFKYKNRYLTYCKDVECIPNDPDEPIKEVYVERYTVKTKKGYPVKITEKGEDNLYRIKFYTKDPKRGLIKEFLWRDSHGGKTIQKFSYTIKKGVVVKAVKKEATAERGEVFERDKSGKIIMTSKKEYKFEYTKDKADNKRYCAMINDIIAGMSNGFSCCHRPIYTYWY